MSPSKLPGSMFIAMSTLAMSCATPTRHAATPGSSWIGLGVERFEPEPSRGSASAEPGLKLEGGHFFVDEEGVRVGAEGFVAYSKHSFSYSYFDPMTNQQVFASESPTNLKLGVGARMQYGDPSAVVSPFLRAGLLYQYFYDYEIDDDGFGFYLGAGADFPLGDAFTFGPELGFSSAALDRADVTEISYGLRLLYSF